MEAKKELKEEKQKTGDSIIARVTLEQLWN
jgi:hypothetical protein